MLSSDFRKTVAPRARILNIIWGAMLAACIVYVVIAWFLYGQSGSPAAGEPTESGGFMTVIFAAVAAAVLVASVVAERVMLAPARLEKQAREIPDADSVFAMNRESGGGASDEQKQLFDRLSDSEKRLAGLGVTYQTAHIVIWAMRESVVVLGLLLAIMQTSFTVILPFAGAGLATLLLKVPRPASFFEAQLGLVRRVS